MKRHLLAAFAFAMVFPVGAPAAAQGGLARIGDNVYAYVGTRNASPSNSFGANAGVIIGRDAIAVVDTLASAKEAARLIGDIRAISQKPIRYVIDTHEHLDHVFGNCEFARLGATIVAHTNCRKAMEKGAEAALRDAKATWLTGDENARTTIAYPDLFFRGTMQIDLGGRIIEIIDPGPSDTEGSVLVYVPDEKILFTGDVLVTDYHAYTGGGSIANWTRTLDRIMAMKVTAIVPGHGPLSGKTDVAAMKDYLFAFESKAKALYAASNDIAFIKAELLKSLPPRPEGADFIDATLRARFRNR